MVNALVPRLDPRPLFERLAGLRRRLRRVTVVRGCCWIAALAVAAVAAVGWLDYRLHLPALLRGLALVGILGGAGVLFVRDVVRPLRGSGNLLGLAKRVESEFPRLNDSLASAVQFLEVPEDSDAAGSPVLRREAINRALLDADECDFRKVVDDRGLKPAVFALLVAAGLGALLLGNHPAKATVALERLALPFGGTQWPAQTRLEILAPQPLPARLARGDSFELRVAVQGVVPERARVALWLEGASPSERVFPVSREAEGGAVLVARYESGRVLRSFKFRVRANDADTGWQEVAVLPPPLLVPLDGRPSPQVRLEFPAYTDLPPAELADGSSVGEFVAGTKVHVRAATDRPVARAWIAYRPEQPRLNAASVLAPLAAANAREVPGAFALGREVWAEVPCRLERGGTVLDVSFVPRVPGLYALRFEDETGLGGTRLFDFRVQPDPAPSVTLERPAPGKDSLTVLPDAEITLQARATDKQFAIRSVFLEYRTARADPPRALAFYDGDALGALLQQTASLMRMPVALPAERVKFRPQAYALDRRLSLAQFTRPDGSPLREGDVLILQVAASDFDDVTGDKQPGRSHEIELTIVSRPTLESLLQQAQAEARGEFQRLRQMQRDARLKVLDAERQLRATGKLRPEDLDALLQAEQLQQQVRTRLTAPDDGLRAEMAKLRQSVRDNHLPRSRATERIDAVAAELERLALEELEPIEPLISAARKEQELGNAKPPSPGRPTPLSLAERHQREVEDTIGAIQERLEPWSGAAEVRGEARMLLAEVKRAADQLRRPGKLPRGDRPEQVRNPDQRGELERSALRQERLAERGRQLVEKVGRLLFDKDGAAQARRDTADLYEQEAAHAAAQAELEQPDSPAQLALNRQAEALRDEAQHLRESAEALQAESAALQRALLEGNGEELKRQLAGAADRLKQNQPGNAADLLRRADANLPDAPSDAVRNLERLIEALEEQQRDPERLAKKARADQDRLNDLIDEQERLQRKVEAAQRLPDPVGGLVGGAGQVGGKMLRPEETQEALRKLAREQDRIERLTRDLAQRLARDGNEPAAQSLRRAAREMDTARQQLEQGEPAELTQDDALDRLDDANAQMDDARQQQEEELVREKLAKVADQVRALRERQQRAVDESARIHAEVTKAGKWDEGLMSSLAELREQQNALADEVTALIEKRFEPMPVFAKLLKQSAEAMKEAGKRIDERRKDALDLPPPRAIDAELEGEADAAIQKRQKLALRRLDQLLESVKPENALAKRPAKNPDGTPQQPAIKARPGDDLPPLAQLKALRSLQAEIAERTEAFDKAHPDRSKLNDDELAELESLQLGQLDVAELIQELTPTPEPEGDKP